MGIIKGALLVGAGIVAGIAATKVIEEIEEEKMLDTDEFDDCDDCCCDDIADSDDIAEAANDFDGNGESVDFSKNPDGELVDKKEIVE